MTVELTEASSSNREVNAREFLVLLNREGNRNLSNTTQ